MTTPQIESMKARRTSLPKNRHHQPGRRRGKQIGNRAGRRGVRTLLRQLLATDRQEG
jgi:hypothetical protein